jgi:hypothetical protein
MLRLFKRGVVIPLLVTGTCLTGGQGEARELQLQTNVGKMIRVFGHLRLSDDCRQGPIPDLTIVHAPTRGSLILTQGRVTLTSPDFGNCSAGHSGMGKIVFYKAQAKGVDNFEYKMSSPGLPTTDWIVRVNIR